MARTNGMADGATAYPAVQNLLLAARALGLGGVLTTQHFFVPGELERVLGLPSTVTLAALLSAGRRERSVRCHVPPQKPW